MFELRVLNGLHEGAALPLSGENWSVGNHEESDLQLCDGEIQSLHAKLSRIDSSWQLMPEGEVFLAHGQPVKDAFSLDVDQPFQLSGVWLVVSEAESPWQSTSLIPVTPEGKIPRPAFTQRLTLKRTFPRWFKPALMLLSLMGVIIMTSWFFAGSGTATQSRNLKPVIADSDGLRSVLVRKLEDRDLTRVVSVSGDNHGVSLTGQVTKTQSAIVNRLMIAMKNTYQIRIPFTNATTLKVLTLPFRIVQITAGKHANIVIEGGKRLFIGDVEAGFTLSKITKDSVQFTGNQNISVAW